MTAADRDLIVMEAEATLAQVHGFRLVPPLAQTEGYFRELAPHLLPGRNVDQEWDLLSHRQAHTPAGVTRLLDVIIDETAFELRLDRPEVMGDQVRHLLALADSAHATVRVIARDAAFWEQRAHNFDVLSFAGTTDRIGVNYTVLGASLASSHHHDVWKNIADKVATDEPESRTMLERHLAAFM